MGWTDQIDAMLLAREATRVKRIAFGVLFLVFLIDLAGAIILREAPALLGDDHTVDWTWRGLLDGLQQITDDTVDCLVLYVCRSVLLIFLGWLAVRLGTPKLADLQPVQPAEEVCVSCGNGASSIAEPLLINSVNGGPPPVSGAASSSASATASPPPITHKPTTEVKEEHLQSHKRKILAENRKNVLIGAIFIVGTTAQVYIGVKCIGFDGLWRTHHNVMTLQGALMGLSVLLINIEAWLIKRLINTLTAEEGFLVPEFHPHRLFFQTGLSRHRCDMCRNNSVQMYRCTLCDFDACPACFNKKDKATSEGILRGDKGIKQGGELSFAQYFGRAIRLVQPHIPLFLFAILCLGAKSGINLILPNYQGTIFDHVIAATHACGGPANGTLPNPFSNSSANPQLSPECIARRHDFQVTVTMYLLYAILIGLLGGLQSLSFMVVGRKIMVHVRHMLFRRVIIQDVAFFDGMRTGDLVQRLQGDTRAMIQPLQYTFSTLLSNLVLLVGGVVMCFYTSWRLSMLAFTTVLPIMHVTESYAKWSGKINKQIFQHYSDGSAIVTEALTNVRTVRATSSEDFEIGRYDETLHLALRKGILDSFLGALSAAFNNYLDLGAGVLILWYGGSIVMDVDGRISVGKLITYQLYWNMLNNSLQALNNILNSFTRAAGAAERVLSLVDLEPDIDPNGGAPVDVAVRKWDLHFDDVHFRYQMRPLNRVLAGLSFEVHDGSVCALVGKSGGGKSTLIHLMLRFYDPTDGKITLGGVDLKQLNLASVHRKIGVVSQDTQLFNTTIAENIKYGIEGEVDMEEVEAACKAAQAYSFITEFEDGLMTRVGERGQRLSGGQKQRIAIARCLLRKPKLLLLDEATSALDAESEAAVQKALDEMIWTGAQTESGGYTVLLVAHRLSTVVNSDQIVVIDKGACVEKGKHDALLSKEGVYAGLVAYQLQKQKEDLEESANAAAAADKNGGARNGGSGGGGGFVRVGAPHAPGEAAAAAGRRRPR